MKILQSSPLACMGLLRSTKHNKFTLSSTFFLLNVAGKILFHFVGNKFYDFLLIPVYYPKKQVVSESTSYGFSNRIENKNFLNEKISIFIDP